jgi:hypothetical protein
MSKSRLLLVILPFVVACAGTPTYERVESFPLTNERGHVVGHRDVLRNETSGEEIERVTTYAPRYDSRGEVVGYEEPVGEGVVIRSLDGRRVGLRYRDLRGRGSNPTSEGVSVTYPQ